MKKSIKIIIAVFLIIIIIYTTYISNYRITKKEQKRINALADKLIIKDIKVINKEEVDEYYTFNNIKFIDISNEFNCSTKKNKLICKKEDIEFDIIIDEDLITKYKKTNYKDIKGNIILKNKKIKDDINLMGLIKETKNYNPYLKPISEVKEIYSIQKFALKEIKRFNSIELINSPYIGYIYNIDSNTKEVVFNKNNKNYSLVFKNLNYFTKSKRSKIISSIIIE